ncbi:MAG: hypothetical protein IPQ07_14550 [Myxococcales bacterium]|nr:hypothetical protein [Myxococcales bacterium]
MRRSLVDVELTGKRATVRRVTFMGLLVLAVVGAVALLGERHRTDYSEWHSTFGETSGVPLLVSAAMLGLLGLAVRASSVITGVVAGMVTTIGAIVNLGALVIVHLINHTEHNAAGGIAAGVMLGLAPLGLIAMIIELVVRVQERKKLEASDPEFPAARVVRD